MRQAMGSGGVRHYVQGIGYFEFRLDEFPNGELHLLPETLLREVQQAVYDLGCAGCSAVCDRFGCMGGPAHV
jgi:hypothetical protein